MPETKIGGVTFTISGDNRDLNRKVRQARRRLQTLETTAKKVGSRLRGLRLPGGLGLGIAFGLAARSSIKFETSLSRIVGLVGVSRKEVARMGEAIKRLGPEVSRGPNELAEALFFITSAGLRGSEAMETLKASAMAASAGLGETKVIADAVTSAINAYGAANLSAGDATGILVAAVREGKLEAGALAPVMGRLLPMASELGVEFHEVAAALATLSRTGLNAAEASTALRGVLQVLMRPTRIAVKEFLRAGIGIEEMQRKLDQDGLLRTLEWLKESVGGSSRAISKLFPNVEGLQAVFGLVGKNAKFAEAIFRSLAKSGLVDLQKSAAVAAETTEDKLNAALAKMSEIGIELGQAVLPPVVDWLHRILGLGEQVSKMELPGPKKPTGVERRRNRRASQQEDVENYHLMNFAGNEIDLSLPRFRGLSGAEWRRARRQWRRERQEVQDAIRLPEMTEDQFGELVPFQPPPAARPRPVNVGFPGSGGEGEGGGGEGAGEDPFLVREQRQIVKAYEEALRATLEGEAKINAEVDAAMERRLQAVRDAVTERLVTDKEGAAATAQIEGAANAEREARIAEFREREAEAREADLQRKMESDRRYREWELSLMDERDADLERLADWYLRQTEMAETFRDEQRISEAEHQANMTRILDMWNRRRTAIEAKHLTARQKFERMSTQRQVTTILGELSGLLGGITTHSKKVFRLQKAAAIANAVVNTYQGISKTLATYPWPIAGVLAAVHAAAGFAQVQAISRQQFGGGSTTSASVGGGGSTAPPAFADTPVGSNLPAAGDDGDNRNAIDVRIVDVEDDLVLTGRQVRSLIEQINEEISDGAVIGSLRFSS